MGDVSQVTSASTECDFLARRAAAAGRRWHGRYHKGHMRCVREAKEREALQRNHRAPRCTAPPRDEIPVTSAARCPWPHKHPYENQAAARSALKHMDRHKRGQGLNPYHCRAGHWHLGRRLTRAIAAWRK